MNKAFFLICICCTLASAETIDKIKILEIIKAAKKHKSVKIEKKDLMYVKEKSLSKAAKNDKIVVYRRKEKPITLSPMAFKQTTNLEYGKLPMLGLSSQELKRKYEREIARSGDKPLFTVPQQSSRGSKERTTATKLYF